jgi:hypothetical protein
MLPLCSPCLPIAALFPYLQGGGVALKDIGKLQPLCEALKQLR